MRWERWSKLFEGRTGIGTGGVCGLGAARVEAFLQEGANVGVADLDEKAGQAYVQGLDERGARAFFVQTDVSREEDVKNSDYLSVYGDIRELCAASRRKAAADEALDRWRELRGGDVVEHDAS